VPVTAKGFRYPASSDAPNIPQFFQNLAADIDAYLSGSAVSIAPASGWANLGTFATLQGFRLGNFCLIYGMITNNNAYSAAQTVASTAVPTAFRPAKQVTSHSGVQIGVTAALQSCRMDVTPTGTITVSPTGTIAANSFHAVMITYNVNNV
jgi:hypothetical protein